MTNIDEIPDDAWVSKSFERDVAVGGGGYTFGFERAYPTRLRIVGTLRGDHAELGRVRRVPNIDNVDIRITEVNAYVLDDGTLEPIVDTH